MNRLVKCAYSVMYILLMCLMLFGVLTSRTHLESHMEKTNEVQIFPVEQIRHSDRQIEYKFDFSGKTDTGMALKFLSVHQSVEVYVDQKQIYLFDVERSIFGTTPGTKINFVEIPEIANEVSVIVTSAYQNVASANHSFYYGDALAMYHSLLAHSLAPFGLSGVIALVGIGLVVYWVITRKRLSAEISICFFGLFSIILGLWSMNETDLAMLLMKNRTVGSMIGYTLLILMPVPFIQFVRNFFGLQKGKIANYLSLASMIIGSILLVLHMSHIAEFKRTATVIHVIMLISIFYMLGTILYCIKRQGLTHRIRVNLVATFALMVSLVVDLYAYYMGFQQTDVLGKIGAMIYIIILAIESMSDVFEKIEAGRKADYYMSMAKTDVMTGLLNRSAYEEWEENHTKYDDILIVTFDLNNLKECNDCLGHQIGDRYITEAAHLIQRIFGSLGKCYRIGGDEFCAVIMRGSKIHMNHYIDKLRKEEAEFNAKSADLQMGIAVGYAIYEGSDENFGNTRDRADEYMYRNKKMIKKIEE